MASKVPIMAQNGGSEAPSHLYCPPWGGQWQCWVSLPHLTAKEEEELS